MPAKIERPHCHNRSFTWMQKQFLGPARKIECPDCGAKVSVSWQSLWVYMAILVPSIVVYQIFKEDLNAAIGKAGTIGLLMAVGAVYLVFSSFYQHRYVDLEVREPGQDG